MLFHTWYTGRIMRTQWESPYQTPAYYEGLLQAGVPMEKLETPQGVIYFDCSSAIPTAWELSATTPVDLATLKGRAAYRLCASSEQRNDSYYTLALGALDPRFSNRFMRNVKKAKAAMPLASLELAETDRQLQQALAQFADHPDRRDNIAQPDFTRRVKALGEAGAMLTYALLNDGEVIATACALTSSTQANMRYYTAERINQAGHLNIYRVVEELFANRALDIVDLSGISPVSGDKKMNGIDEFKYQIGGSVLEFEKL
jgi:hypothetical protein